MVFSQHHTNNGKSNENRTKTKSHENKILWRFELATGPLTKCLALILEKRIKKSSFSNVFRSCSGVGSSIDFLLHPALAHLMQASNRWNSVAFNCCCDKTKFNVDRLISVKLRFSIINKVFSRMKTQVFFNSGFWNFSINSYAFSAFSIHKLFTSCSISYGFSRINVSVVRTSNSLNLILYWNWKQWKKVYFKNQFSLSKRWILLEKRLWC